MHERERLEPDEEREGLGGKGPDPRVGRELRVVAQQRTVLAIEPWLDVDRRGDVGLERAGGGLLHLAIGSQIARHLPSHPGKITVGLDVKPDEELVTRGWTIDSGRYMEEVLIELSSAGVIAFMVQEAGRDALAEQSNLGILRRAIGMVSEPVIAGGGARDLEDLQHLVDLEDGGRRLGGVVVGREVTEGRFTMEQARAILDDR